jgi:tight adherence protein C
MNGNSPTDFIVSSDVFALLACGCTGLAIYAAGRWIQSVLRSEDLTQGTQWRYDVTRINELRRVAPLYRTFQPVVSALAQLNRRVFREGLAQIQRDLQVAGLPRCWLAEEYLAQAELLALLVTPLHAYYFLATFGVVGLLPTIAVLLLTVWFLRRRLARQAAERLQTIKRRLPFVLDLLTLLMEAGATFLKALSEVVEEYQGHPIADEFGRVLSDIDLGKTRHEAFSSLRNRLADEEVTSIIGAMLQGEHLGTPLARILRTQAELLRVKRTQRAERIAGEAAVKMLLPGVVVMLATVLVIVAPFVINYLAIGFELSP